MQVLTFVICVVRQTSRSLRSDSHIVCVQGDANETSCD